MAAGLGAISWLDSRNSALAQLAIQPQGKDGEVLVVIFLRGGADGLNVVVPYREDAYYRLRPSLHIPAPNDSAAAPKDRALDLDGFFGLHPAMAPLLDLYHAGELGFVHAAGSFDQTRSHFDAMSAMERGLPTAAGTLSSGWLARHLNASPSPNGSPLRAVAFSNVMPASLKGASDAIALEDLCDYRLETYSDDFASAESELRKLYGSGKDMISLAGQNTLAALKRLRALQPDKYVPDNGARYPNSDLGKGLSQVALMIKANLGLEVACLDKGGWDTHVAQGATTGWQASLQTDLAASLAAFAKDLGQRMSQVTLVALTEFGRRAYENSGLGTDHGRGSFMILLGGGIVGGKVHSQWPGLEDGQLEGPGDLKVTTDYRNVLAEALQRKFDGVEVPEVFPGLAYSPAGMFT